MSIPEDTSWGRMKADIIVKENKSLFPRIDEKTTGITDRNISNKLDCVEKKKVAEPQKPIISISEFQKIDLRVGRVISAEKVEGASKLLKMCVDFENEQRTLVAGIKEFYNPEEVVGKNIVVVYNLAPAKIRGIESQGMLLAASNEEGVVLLTTDQDISPGSKIR